MARWQETRPQCLRPHPRRVRGKAQGIDRRNESRDCGSTTADGFGRGRWKSAGRKEGQSGKGEKLIKLSQVSNIWYPRQLSIKNVCNLKADDSVTESNSEIALHKQWKKQWYGILPFATSGGNVLTPQETRSFF